MVEVCLVKKKSNTVEETKFYDTKVCHIFPMSASVYQAVQLLPEILHQVQELLLVQQFKKKNNFDFVDDTMLLEAFSASSSGKLKNYERLEFLGDSVLKFIVSSYLYVNYRDYQEGELTTLRTAITKNKALTEHAKSLKLYQYIVNGVTSRKLWRPPNFYCELDSDRIRQRLAYHGVSDKTLADVVESTIGASYLSGSLDAAIQAMRLFGIPLESKRWSDISNTKREAVQGDFDTTSINVAQLSKSLGYDFQDHTLVYEALVHRSASCRGYERLEFLGDALFDYCVTQYLYEKHPTADPAMLHSLRKSSVNYQIQSAICLKLELHKYIVYSAPSIAAKVMEFERKHREIMLSGEDSYEYWLNCDPPKMLADVTESILGAVLVDSGFDMNRVKRFFEQWVKPILENHISLDTISVHPMTQLTLKIQEMGCVNWEIK
ncbi:ribonuclease III domain-containing protein [Sporodiniella umbellata]|nr:ribonuclease III domain-containing protein [Sporodiniella umbellata]